jgi:signal transduction histidine kinase
MFPLEPHSIATLIGCIIYLAAAILTLRHYRLRRQTSGILLGYLGLAFTACLLELIFHSAKPDHELVIRINHYWVVLSVFLFLELTWKTLRVRPRLLLRILWLVWLAVFILIDFNLLGISENTYRALNFSQPNMTGASLSVGWLGFIWYVFYLALKALRKPYEPVTRNRGYYWVLALIFIASSDFLFLFDVLTLGHILRWPGVLFAAAVVIREFMPDTRVVERIALNYLVMTTLTASVLIVGLLLTPPLFDAVQANYNAALAGMVVAIFLAALLSPLWVFSQKIVQRIVPPTQYDTSLVLREYSQSLSNILEPDLLASAAVGLVRDAIEIERGYLFLVDSEQVEGKQIYRLRPSKGIGDTLPIAGALTADSPITAYLRKQHKPLRQTELELNPIFQSAPKKESAWFASLGAEVYMPIYTKDDWMGLIALGPKTSGTPYLDEDLALLATLADQTAVALQNARLVESLMRLNNDFRRAYAAMEQANSHLKRANQQLQNLDRTKSDFINVASHELRTPLTIMRGYNELLLEDEQLNANVTQAKLVKGIYTGITRLHEIINSMLDMASIDTRTFELRVELVSIFQVIQTVLTGLSAPLKERNLHLDSENLSDLPQIEGDPDALRKVFYHVIINAIKFTPDGGSITISGVPVSPGQLGLAEGGVEIIVADRGIGIDAEYMELIFTKFYQTGEIALHSSGRTKFKGAGPGLGLAIAKGIVEAHRGRIWAESSGYDEQRCPGSAFHIILPLHFPKNG